ncbi:MAG TPA: hypothetical protein VL137_00710 [Polyangiaceae bacterium]|nr:hypothetical protein [Polyangiaceae bacterium]
MTDPQRLLGTRLLDTQASDAAGALERELLGSLRPDGRAQSAVWQRMMAQGVIAAGVTTAAGTAAIKAVAATNVAAETTAAAAAGKAAAATTSLGASLVAKAGLALIVAAPVVGGGLYLAHSAAQPPPVISAPAAAVVNPAARGAAKPIAVSPPVSVPAPAAPTIEVIPDSAKSEAPSSSVKSSADALKEENRLLLQARALDHSGNPQQALRVLDELDQRFAHGALIQERETLRISALSAAGSTTAAKARAKQFLERFPKSPYAAHAQAILAN